MNFVPLQILDKFRIDGSTNYFNFFDFKMIM